MTNEEPKKKNIFSRMFFFFSSLTKDKIKKIKKSSAFKSFYIGIEKNSDLYFFVDEAVNLCEEAIKTTIRKNNLLKKMEGLEEKIEELDCFYKLTDKDIKELEFLFNKFKNVSKEKSELYFQLTGFANSLGYLEEIEEDANIAVAQIQNAEKKKRMLRHDIGYIEGEKADLEYEKDMLDSGLKFIHRFTIFMVLFFALGSLIISYSAIFNRTVVTIPAFVLFLSVILMSTMIFIFKRRSRHEIQLNLKKQERAVELLNKKNVVLAYYMNFLKYEYKKYKVRNSQSLKNSLKDLDSYKHLNKRYEALRKVVYKTEEEIDIFLKYKNIKDSGATLDRFANSLNLEDKKAYFNEISEQLKTFELELEKLETRHREIWGELLHMEQNDISSNNTINSIIQEYYRETGETEEVEVDKEVSLV